MYVNYAFTYNVYVILKGQFMKCNQFYPVIMTDRVSATAQFYIQHFGFEPQFASDWYVHLQATEAPTVNLAILQAGHETIPGKQRVSATGLLLNFEVDDVDAQFDRLSAAGVPMVLSLRDEAFGQRHFITQDPNGVLIDIIKPIPPTAAFLSQYAQGSAASD